MRISIVVPFRDEARNVDALFLRLVPILESLTPDWEIVCVNDGSEDDTLARLCVHNEGDSRIKILDLSRNFGKDIALTAGMAHTTGDVVVPMDADLQHPPEVIPELVGRWRDGWEVVVAIHRRRTGEGWFRKNCARLFYWLVERFASVPIPEGEGDFRLMSRPVVDAVCRLPERTRFMKGLFSWVGFRKTAVYFDRETRFVGKSRWKFWKLWNFALDGIIAFSSFPLKIWGYVGICVAGGALAYSLFLLLRTLILGVDVPGYASIIVCILFLGGVQLFSLGVLGEYLARVYDETKARPLFVIRQSYGFDRDNAPKC